MGGRGEVLSSSEGKDSKKERRTSPAAASSHPSPQEISEHVAEKGYSFSPAAFLAFYESNGWKIGKNPMKSWKAACVTWQGRESPRSNGNGTGAPKPTGYIGDDGGWHQFRVDPPKLTPAEAEAVRLKWLREWKRDSPGKPFPGPSKPGDEHVKPAP